MRFDGKDDAWALEGQKRCCMAVSEACSFYFTLRRLRCT
jgi:hypothetical protein